MNRPENELLGDSVFRQRNRVALEAFQNKHLGQHITITTGHTTATGVLQGFRHETDTINDSSCRGEFWALGKTRTPITFVPDQRIIAGMKDQVTMHERHQARPSAAAKSQWLP